jgi:hypothetical protein
MVLPHARATRIAATVAQVLSAAMAAIGLMTGSPNLLFVALFVFLAARREAREGEFEAQDDAGPAALRPGVPGAPPPIGETRSCIVLPAHARADEVTPVLFQRQDLYPVAQGGQVVGVVSKGRLLWAIANGHGNRLIAELMNQTGGEGPQFALATVKKR